MHKQALAIHPEEHYNTTQMSIGCRLSRSVCSCNSCSPTHSDSELELLNRRMTNSLRRITGLKNWALRFDPMASSENYLSLRLVGEQGELVHSIVATPSFLSTYTISLFGNRKTSVDAQLVLRAVDYILSQPVRRGRKRLVGANWDKDDSGLAAEFGLTKQRVQYLRSEIGHPPIVNGLEGFYNARFGETQADYKNLPFRGVRAGVAKLSAALRTDIRTLLVVEKTLGVVRPRHSSSTCFTEMNWDLPTFILAGIWKQNAFTIRNTRLKNNKGKSLWGLANQRSQSPAAFRNAVSAEQKKYEEWCQEGAVMEEWFKGNARQHRERLRTKHQPKRDRLGEGEVWPWEEQEDTT